jgi:hypothetical protein
MPMPLCTVMEEVSGGEAAVFNAAFEEAFVSSAAGGTPPASSRSGPVERFKRARPDPICRLRQRICDAGSKRSSSGWPEWKDSAPIPSSHNSFNFGNKLKNTI